MQVLFLGKWALGSDELGYKKSRGVADAVLWWGHPVRGSSGMHPGQFAIPCTSLRVTVQRAPFQRGESAAREERSHLSSGCCGDRQHPTVKMV